MRSCARAREPACRDADAGCASRARARAGDYFIVVGAALERFVQMTNWEFFESVQRFSFVMKKVGVWSALKAAGAAATFLTEVSDHEST